MDRGRIVAILRNRVTETQLNNLINGHSRVQFRDGSYYFTIQAAYVDLFYVKVSKDSTTYKQKTFLFRMSEIFI